MNAPVTSSRPKTPLLDRVLSPADLRNLSLDQLKQLADELRAETIDAVASTGGHLGASLGVVELTVAPRFGAMTPYLPRLLSSPSFLSFRDLAARMAQKFPRAIERTARRADEFARGILTGGTLFEELGFYYVGPIDGHNLDHLLPI